MIDNLWYYKDRLDIDELFGIIRWGSSRCYNFIMTKRKKVISEAWSKSKFGISKIG